MVPRRGNAIPPPGHRYFTEVRLTEFLGSSHSPGPLRQGFLCRVSEVRSLMYIRV
jgi:hypothetical protein